MLRNCGGIARNCGGIAAEVRANCGRIARNCGGIAEELRRKCGGIARNCEHTDRTGSAHEGTRATYLSSAQNRESCQLTGDGDGATKLAADSQMPSDVPPQTHKHTAPERPTALRDSTAFPCCPFGTPVVPIWYTRGTHLVHSWYPFGTPVVPIWYTCGTHLVHALCAFGAPVIPILYTRGTHLVHPLYPFGTPVVPSWYTRGRPWNRTTY